ncbi:peptidase M24, structural domain-containing protein [Hyaloraphidium curvatum]|nr:peptidase M24, structural domain-containing protein [Hyaloraphidium curvatum]
MRNATRLAAEALQVASKMIRPGVTTDEIDSAVYDAIIAGKGYPSPLGYMGFPNSICTSVSNVMVHGIPDDRPLESGDLINVDVTVFHSGFHGDTSATFLVGDVDSEGRRLVEVTHEALRRAIAVCGPGTPFSLIGKTISILARKEGYTVSKSYCGHGIGRSFHELPLVYHHYNEDDGVMEEGMTFTIEPLLCQGSDAEVKWGDGWTVASQDGGRSAQFEHTVLITSDGASVMTL